MTFLLFGRWVSQRRQRDLPDSPNDYVGMRNNPGLTPVV